MNKINIYILKLLRKGYLKVLSQKQEKPLCEQDADLVSLWIIESLSSDSPCMIARFGSTEMICLSNYTGIAYSQHKIGKYLLGKGEPWWWEESIFKQMQMWSGFFPPTQQAIEQFCKLMLEDISLTDILGSWLVNEKYFDEQLAQAKKVNLELLNPYFSKIPWTKALEGKKVLVVHPFSQTIQQQYLKRKLLFKDNLLPEFELKTLKAIQTIAGVKSEFEDWFEALDFMKSEIDKIDYDICLIAAGAYGFPLAAHVKRMGKKGFHLGGSLQLLFGIKGARWDRQYNDVYNYSQFYNEHWVRPSEQEKPKDANKVEGACYW